MDNITSQGRGVSVFIIRGICSTIYISFLKNEQSNDRTAAHSLAFKIKL